MDNTGGKSLLKVSKLFDFAKNISLDRNNVFIIEYNEICDGQNAISMGLNAPQSQSFPETQPLDYPRGGCLQRPQTPQLFNSAAAAASNAASRQ